MNGKELFEKFTNINHCYIEEVENTVPKKKFHRSWVAFAACFCLAITTVFATSHLGIFPFSPGSTSSSDSANFESGIEDTCGAIGICIVSDSSYIIIIDNCPVVMINDTDDETIFDDLQTGDTILIEYSHLMESYPGKTTIYYLEILEKGTIEDVPQEVIDSLNELNWEIHE